MCTLIFFFFNDPDTTEIYTYLHTLSLHDALPILNNPLSNISTSCQILLEEWQEADAETRKTLLTQIDEQCERARNIVRSLLDFARSRNFRRSEEHTSELQSLMRTSYAVFCLKKNTTLISTNTSIHH